MIKLLKKISAFFLRIRLTWNRVKSEEFYEDVLKSHIEKVKRLEVACERKLSNSYAVYTTVRSYNSENGDNVFWPWVRSVLLSDEYKYLVFTLRENVIRELSQTYDTVRVHEANGQLKMLMMLDSYLTKGLTQYDAEHKKV